jgi:TRAP-type C4-dicarboxylate transport system permease small subunit
MDSAARGTSNTLGHAISSIAVFCAYLGGVIVSAIGIMSVISIVGRTTMGHPIQGDFELVEIGTAVAGSLFLPYCQASGGHIVVDFFTLRAGAATRRWLDRFGCLLMAAMFLAVGWRAIYGAIGLYSTGETSMLMSIPTWLGYAGVVPGTLVAGLIALAQALGGDVPEHAGDE